MIIDTLETWLADRGLDPTQVVWAMYGITTIGTVLAAWLANVIAKTVLVRVVSRMARATKTDWDNILVEKKFFNRLAQFAPAAVFWLLAPVVWARLPAAETFTQRAAVVYMLVVLVLVVDALLNAVDAIYQTYDASRRISITLYVQIVKLVVFIAIGIVAVSTVIDRSPLALLTGLGAVTAILLLIFKDTILSASWQACRSPAHDMMRHVGDWIEMPTGRSRR